MTVIRLAGLITLFLFGTIFVIAGLVTASVSWTSPSPYPIHGLLIAVLGFVLIGSGVYVARRPKN